MYIAEAKCLMSYECPNGPSAECSRRSRAWQRSRTPNKHVDNGEIEGEQKKGKDSFFFEQQSAKCLA